jgi:polyisoprenoid-binding protein YceI
MRTLLVFFCCFIIRVNCFGQNLYSGNNGDIKFRSEARLELIDAASDKMKSLIDADKKTFAFSVPINSFSGFNAELQREHFNEKYMESTKFPTAFFKGKIIEDIDIKKNGTLQVRAKGTLSVHGVEQERIIKATIVINNGVLTITSKFSLLLSDHHIKVPRVVHEKIATEIFVDVKAELKK